MGNGLRDFVRPEDLEQTEPNGGGLVQRSYVGQLGAPIPGERKGASGSMPPPAPKARTSSVPPPTPNARKATLVGFPSVQPKLTNRKATASSPPPAVVKSEPPPPPAMTKSSPPPPPSAALKAPLAVRRDPTMDLSLDDESVTEMDAEALPKQPTQLVAQSDTDHDGVELPMLSGHLRMLAFRDRAKEVLAKAGPAVQKLGPLFAKAKPAAERAVAWTKAASGKIAANVDKEGIRRELGKAALLIARAVAYGALSLAEIIDENVLPRLERWTEGKPAPDATEEASAEQAA